MAALHDPFMKKKKVELPIPPTPQEIPEIDTYSVVMLRDWKLKLYEIQEEFRIIKNEKPFFGPIITPSSWYPRKDTFLDLIDLSRDIENNYKIKLSSITDYVRVNIRLRTEKLKEIFSDVDFRVLSSDWYLKNRYKIFEKIKDGVEKIKDSIKPSPVPLPPSLGYKPDYVLYKKSVNKLFKSSLDFINYLSNLLEKTEVQPS